MPTEPASGDSQAGDPRTEVSAQDVVDAVLAVPGVTGLHGGVFGEVATYLPGGRVSGVALDEHGGQVHVVIDISHDLRAVADAVRETASRVAGVPMSVTVEDITTGESGDERGPVPTRPTHRGASQDAGLPHTTRAEDDG